MDQSEPPVFISRQDLCQTVGMGETWVTLKALLASLVADDVAVLSAPVCANREYLAGRVSALLDLDRDIERALDAQKPKENDGDRPGADARYRAAARELRR